MRLILARHGNTFEPGSVPYCIGATEDLPLVEKGRVQAVRFGQALKDSGVIIAAWCRGPLVRHKQFSEIAVGVSGNDAVVPVIDERLNEIDYGSWAGLTDQQVIDEFGAATHEGWALRSKWPYGMDWKPSLDQLRGEITSFLSDLIKKHKATDTVVAVSSGGRLRFFLEAAVPGEFKRRCESQDIKISTGHIGVLNYADGNWSLVCWNVEPSAIDVSFSAAALS